MSTDEIEVDTTGLTWDKPHFYLDGKIFVPRIYEMPAGECSIPEGYNTVSIQLDGKVSADLDWKEQETAAQKYCEQGFTFLASGPSTF